MNMRLFGLVAGAGIALGSCSGGGSSAPTPSAALPSAPQTAAPQARGSIPMSFVFAPKATSSATRHPQYLSNGTASMALYDGATLAWVANISLDSSDQFTLVYANPNSSTSVTPGSCTFTSARATCTATIASTAGPHTFGIVTYPNAQSGTPPAFQGIILSEGQFSVTLAAGANPPATLDLNGVADQVLFAGLSEAAYNDTVTYGFRIEDAANSQIVQPGTYDNGPVTVTASPAGVVTITPSSFASPPSSAGDQNFDVQCVNAAGGNVTISFNTATHPNTAYASGLTYSTANYSGSTIQSIPFTCDAASGTIPITVQGARR